MKKIAFYVCFCISLFAFAQPNTEVFLFDLSSSNSSFTLSNFKNISNNDGYDNQPSFLNNNTLFYAGTRNGQTDIVRYNINYDSKIFVNHTEGSEYSPLKIPGQNYVSSIRLEKDGAQKLYKYNLSNGESEVLVEDIVIGYHVWFNKDILVSSVLDEGNLSLFATHFKDAKNYKLQNKIGRSLHIIPNTKLVSYISKEDDNLWEIKSLDPISGVTKSIAATLAQSEDMCWLPDGTILSAKDGILYIYKPGKHVDWNEVASLEAYGIKNISRVAVSPDGKKLAVVGELIGSQSTTETTTTEDNASNTTSPTANTMNAEDIVQKHIDPFNNRDLDAFANAFAENVVVSNYPNDTSFVGRQNLKQNYKRFFDANSSTSVSVNNRIILKDYVIDDEIATVGNAMNRHATIYKTSSNSIQSMTFIKNRKATTNPEQIVDKQLLAYNKKDLDAFMATYSNDVKLYNYPNQLTTDGQEDMRKGYKDWFNRASDLKAVIKKRIVIGNKVIDKETVTANGQAFEAIAIYEVENGLITKVTFIQ